MDLKEVTDLIKIRNYISNSISNSSIDKSTISVLSGMLILVDNKILSILQGSEFKEYIDYKDVKRAIQDVIKITNIRSGLKK